MFRSKTTAVVAAALVVILFGLTDAVAREAEAFTEPSAASEASAGCGCTEHVGTAHAGAERACVPRADIMMAGTVSRGIAQMCIPHAGTEAIGTRPLAMGESRQATKAIGTRRPAIGTRRTASELGTNRPGSDGSGRLTATRDRRMPRRAGPSAQRYSIATVRPSCLRRDPRPTLGAAQTIGAVRCARYLAASGAAATSGHKPTSPATREFRIV